jgi:hypothetical protein
MVLSRKYSPEQYRSSVRLAYSLGDMWLLHFRLYAVAQLRRVFESRRADGVGQLYYHIVSEENESFSFPAPLSLRRSDEPRE